MTEGSVGTLIKKHLDAIFGEWEPVGDWQREYYVLEAYNICQDADIIGLHFDGALLKKAISKHREGDPAGQTWPERLVYYRTRWMQDKAYMVANQLLDKAASATNPQRLITAALEARKGFTTIERQKVEEDDGVDENNPEAVKKRLGIVS